MICTIFLIFPHFRFPFTDVHVHVLNVIPPFLVATFFFFCAVPPMYDLFMPGLCFLICVYLPLPLRQHSFVRSPSTVPPLRLPFLSIVIPPPHPVDTHPCLSHITSTSITAHLHHCMHILSRFFLHPPCRSQSHIVISLSPCILSFPPPSGLSISHPSLTLCICYMILHRPAVCGHSCSPFGYLKPPEKPLWCIPSSESI